MRHPTLYPTLGAALNRAAELAHAARGEYLVFDIVSPDQGFLVLADRPGNLPPWPYQWRQRQTGEPCHCAAVSPWDAA